MRPRPWPRHPRPLTAAPGRSALRAATSAARSWRIRRRAAPDLALVLELLARELRGGASLTAAMAALPADADLGLREVRVRIDLGAAVGDELDRWSRSLPERDGVLVRGVIRLGVSTGAALADALDRTAEVLRERRQLADELRALSAQSRASATMIAAAPIGFLAVFALADPGAITFLIASPLGLLCLGAGLVLDGVGFWWMRRLVAAVIA
ncbi:MAG: type II secretion system F family protein [Actinomycetota bacterium]